MEASVKNFIENLGLFEDLSQECIEILSSSSFKTKLKKGEMLFYEKDIVNNIYIVLKGKLTIFRHSEIGQKRVIYILDKGQILNEVILDNIPASASCEAFEDSWVLGIHKEAFLKTMSMDFRLVQRVMNSMNKKIRRLYRQLKNTIPIKIDKKLAAKLWKLSKDYGIEIEEGVLIDLDISVTYLADMLGSTRETVSRCLKTLKREGFIKYKNKRIVVTDRKQLSVYFKGL
ncbi:Crp/Fnr family transcriptional regulator [Clostridium formicaceticum]|uniref:Crp/Fnr family transcriptional regulator n=1 Tax=Clostridium formicaceticum TaxID=1497 RepID=A0AAC9RJE7_9CLOT|nr:Crp/Fnr family transcriptional regulator [Clostridium formicaceticum]AOY76200.1 Crp/Fnr family transcriptional regulator [Clostridium formicaceticum]ARE86575.1 cAMP receptor protein [Clostridium formicaceticum]